MNFTNIKLTQNQQLLVNALLSMFGSALIAAAQALYQDVTQRGLINLQQVLLVFAGALWVTFSTALVAYIPAHVQQDLAAAKDTALMAQQELATLKAAPTPVQVAPVAAPTLSPVTIHITSAIPPTVTAAPTTQSYQAPATESMQARADTVPMPPVELPAQFSQSVSLPPSAPVQSVQQITNPIEPIPGDILGDVPQSPATMPDRITGVMPVYGASSGR
jgi:hypothetical protein